MLFLSFRPGTTRRVNQLQTEHKQRKTVKVNEKKERLRKIRGILIGHLLLLSIVSTCEIEGGEKGCKKKNEN